MTQKQVAEIRELNKYDGDFLAKEGPDDIPALCDDICDCGLADLLRRWEGK